MLGPPEEIVTLIYEKIDVNGEGKEHLIVNPGLMQWYHDVPALNTTTVLVRNNVAMTSPDLWNIAWI